MTQAPASWIPSAGETVLKGAVTGQFCEVTVISVIQPKPEFAHLGPDIIYRQTHRNGLVTTSFLPLCHFLPVGMN